MAESILDDRYQLQEVLGRGGMATVWRAVDLRLDRPVAVKILDSAGRFDPVALERLHREARIVARLAHRNIVAVHDYGAGDHSAYLIMELVEGDSLADRLARGPLPLAQALMIAEQICDALAAAHAAGIVHRDIKPANLLLTADSAVKVCDFGIARLADAATGVTLTPAAMVIGTSEYMAPEQALGGATDARTDLYALGCVLYAMLAGVPPFTGESPIAVLQQHVNAAPPPLHRTDIPPQLAELVAELLAKDPAERPADARAVRSRIAQLPSSPAPGDGGNAPAFAVGVASPLSATPSLAPSAGSGPSPTRYLSPPNGRRRVATHPLPSWTRHTRTAAVVIAVALIGAATIWLLTTHAAGTRVGQAQAPSHRPSTSPSSKASPRATTPAPTQTTAQTAAGQVAAIQATISQLVDAGQLDPDAAKDLRGNLDDLTRRHGKDHNKQSRGKLDDLRQKLDELRRDGKLTTSGYDSLTTELDKLAAFLPTDNSGEN